MLTTLHNISDCAMATAILTAIFLFFLWNKATRHGYVQEKVSKNFFILFYLYGLALCICLNVPFVGYPIYLARRLIECVFLRYNKSYMSYPHFLFAFLYYTFIIVNIQGHAIHTLFLFLVANFLQTIAHILIFKYRIKQLQYSHYVCEFAMYAIVYYNIPSLFFLLNLIWIATFAVITVLNRKRLEENNK